MRHYQVHVQAMTHRHSESAYYLTEKEGEGCSSNPIPRGDGMILRLYYTMVEPQAK